MNQRTGLAISAALTAIGIVGALMLLIKGHGVMGTSHQFPWGIFISTYLYFALIGSGLCLISSLGCVFGIEPFTAITRRSVVLAMITLSAAFLIMGLETPQPLNMIYMLFSPNFSAAIFWMGSLYGVYLFFLVGEFWYLIVKASPSRGHFFGVLAFFAALAASSNLGAVFGFLHARPYWEGAYMPVYFILTALPVGFGSAGHFLLSVGRPRVRLADSACHRQINGPVSLHHVVLFDLEAAHWPLW